MKFVFFGTPEFAAIILKKLIETGFTPEAVICNPDRPVGRKKIITPPPTKVLAEKYDIKIFQPDKFDKQFLDSLFMIHDSFDFFIVAAYAKILPKEIIDIPRLGVIGVHPSLLPKYRGASPIQGAILGGEKETGVTLYMIDEKMDHGPIIGNSKFEIRNSKLGYKELEKNLADLSGNLLVETLPKFVSGEIKPQLQDESEATYTKKFSTDDSFVNSKILDEALNGKNPQAAAEIHRKVLALTPEPGVWTIKNDKRIKIFKTEIKNNSLVLKLVQVEGQKTPKAE